MGKTLIITEKPSVARDYAKVLDATEKNISAKSIGYLYNDNYIITWCFGHLVTMSYPQEYDPAYKKWQLDMLPFLPEQYRYELIKDSAPQFKVISKLMNDSGIDTILYGGDSGREGEYIGRLVRMLSGVRKGIVEKRIWIDSFTEDEIKRGIREAKPLSDYDNLSDAAYMRAIEDYATGINFSRAYSCKYGRTFNERLNNKDWKPMQVGRVMTCVMGMIVAREREIRNFVPQKFYKIHSLFDGLDLEWKTQEKSSVYNSPVLYSDRGFKKQEDAESFVHNLPNKVVITAINKTQERKKPAFLYNLAELQSDCAKLFKISPSETLGVAQSLYEKKLTTYPRTDARVLSSAVAKEIDKNIRGLVRVSAVAQFANHVLQSGSYAGVEKTQYTNDKLITDHYAIIPTGDTSSLGALSDLEKSVYELICRRFLAIFYPAAVFNKVSLEATAKFASYEEKFDTSTKYLAEPGFMEVTGIEEKDKEGKIEIARAISALQQGSERTCTYNITAGETQPPKRFSSGSIILAMENAGSLIEEEELRAQIKGCGIGTSATRAEILKKLIDVGYIKTDKKTQILTPCDAGELLYDIVKEITPELLSPKITANWELGLQQIADGKITRQRYEAEVNNYVTKGVDKIKNSGSINSSVQSKAADPQCDLTCPICKKPLVKRKSKNGNIFYGCSGYSKDGPSCKFSIFERQYGKNLTQNQLKKLLNDRETDVIKGFPKKDGGTYDTKLVMRIQDGTAKVEFPKRS